MPAGSPLADHVDPTTLETIEESGELAWTFDRRRFMTMLGAAGATTVVGTVAARSAEASGSLLAGTKIGSHTNPVEFTLAELVALYEKRKLSPLEVVQAYVARIEQYDKDYYKAYNAFVPELALAKAKALEKVRTRDRTALWGIPYAPKDNYYTKGILTTGNSDLYQTFVPEYDATYVARLNAAGAVLLGKTQMGPLAGGRPTMPNGVVTTRNAWSPNDSALSPSGSSGGSGTAPPARLAVFCLGTQTGGSITSPTQANACTGMKPTLGRTSVYGVIPLSQTRDHTGPMGRNVKDIAISLRYSDGPDLNDPRTIGVPCGGDYVEAATPVLKHKRAVLRWRTKLGMPPGWADGTTPVALARQNAVQVFKSLGATVVEVEEPPAIDAFAGNSTSGESSEAFREELRGDLRLFNGRLTGFVTGLMRGADHYITGRRAQYLLSEGILEQLFSQCEAMISPPSFDPAGFPLLAFPIGFQPANAIGVTAPIGMIIGGRPYDEVRLLSLVAGFQAATDFHTLRPPEPVVATAAARTLSAGGGEIVVTPEQAYETELAGVES